MPGLLQQGTSGAFRRFPLMPQRAHTQPIDRLSAAESVLSLLGGLSLANAPTQERMALATVQIEATEEWFSAYMELEANSAANALIKMFDSSRRRGSRPLPTDFIPSSIH